MRSVGRRKIRSSVPKTFFWVETESMSAEYFLPNLSGNFQIPKRIRFEDGTQIVTKENTIDFSQKQGVKRIEYVEFLNLNALTDYLFSNSVYVSGLTTVENFAEKYNLVENVDYIWTNKNTGSENIQQKNTLLKNYEITDFKRDTLKSRIYSIDKQKISHFELDENYWSFHIGNNKTELTIDFVGNSTTKTFSVQYSNSVNLNVSDKEEISIQTLALDDVSFNNIEVLDLPIKESGYMRVAGTNLKDIILYPCNTIQLNGNQNFENKNKKIPQVNYFQCYSSSYKSVEFEYPLALKTLNMQDGLRKNYENEFNGTDVLNITECLNLQTLSIIDNPTLIARRKDYSIFTKLKKFSTSGTQDNSSFNLILPNQLESLVISEFSYRGTNCDLSQLTNLKSLEILYMADFRNRIAIGSLDNLNSFSTRFCYWDENYLAKTLEKIANNLIQKGAMFIKLRHLDNRDISEPIIAKIIEQCKRIKNKNWSFHDASNKIILNNI